MIYNVTRLETHMVVSIPGHPYRPKCARAAAAAVYEDRPLYPAFTDDERADWLDSLVERITKDIGAGTCPRCRDPLGLLAGSRITICRCIDICSRCGEREAMPLGAIVDNINWWGSEELGVLDEEADARRDERFRSARSRVISMRGDGTAVVITPEGADLRDRPHPDRWLESGFDDAQDQDEPGS